MPDRLGTAGRPAVRPASAGQYPRSRHRPVRRVGTAGRGGRPPAPGGTLRPAARRPRRPRRLRPLAGPARRLTAGLVVLAVAVLVLAGRLVQLQGVDHGRYTRLAEDQRLQTVPQTATRGDILDRDGHLLAFSEPARDLYADPSYFRDPQRYGTDPVAAAGQLAGLLHLSVADLVHRLTGPGRFSYLARGVSPAVAAAVLALRLPGVNDLPATRRVYPGGPLAASVLGFVGTDGHGLAGIEYALDGLLHGRDGLLSYEVGAGGRPIPDAQHVYQPAVNGSSVQLTLDWNIQWEAQLVLDAQLRTTGASSGTVVVMDPRTGQLLALATAPGFDPNRATDFPAADLGDPAVSDVYEPGSVNKVITMAAALETGVATPDTPYTVPPQIAVAGQVFHDAESHGTEALTLTGVLAKSSNIGTIEVAQRLGPARMYRFLRAFGFGVPTGVGLPGESAGLLPAPATWSGTTLPTIAFGQGIGVTALQVASVYATIADGGVRVTPSIVAGVRDPAGHWHPVPPPAARRVISARTAAELREMLEAVTTEEGTAPAAAIPGYRVAGKTGTAQRPDGQGGYSGYTASFVGFVPADHPQLLVEVVLQQPVHGYFGGTVAAPVFHDVAAFALQVLGIPPTGTRRPVARLIPN